MDLEETSGDQTVKRPANPMPEFVQTALDSRSLFDRYKERPWYQRNDYLGWINRAKKDSTKLKRLNQMLEELESGDAYMKMPWKNRGPMS